MSGSQDHCGAEYDWQNPGKDSSQKIHPPYWLCPTTRHGCLPPSQRDLDQSSHGGSKHLGRLWRKGQHLACRAWLGGCLQPRSATHLGWSHAGAWYLSLLGPVGHACTQYQKMHDEASDMALWLDFHQHRTSSGLSSVPSPLQYLHSPSGQNQQTALQAENLCRRILASCRGKSAQDMIDLISPTLRNIEAYCECSGMHCNDEKVEAMMNRLQPSSFPPIRYAGQETRVLDTLRHLSVILDVQLNFSEHVNSVLRRGIKAANILRVADGRKAEERHLVML